MAPAAVVADRRARPAAAADKVLFLTWNGLERVCRVHRQVAVFALHDPESLMRMYALFPPLAGEFKAWIPHLQRAADMGFDCVFVNPIQLPGSSGSLYSIKDYFQLNPLLLDASSALDPAAQFRQVAAEAEKLGLRLVVDLVVNHCAWDSHLVREHPEWFLVKDGKVVHPSCKDGEKRVVWKDLAQFDHKHTRDKEGLFNFVRRIVEYLIRLGFTGFRCDAAYQVPHAFWKRLITETRHEHPGILFLAETLGCTPALTVQTASAGFDYIFNSSKWWDFQSPWLFEQYALTRAETKSISFPESHDTRRLADELAGNVDGLKQRYFFSAFFSAGVMIPIGFEFGFQNRLDVVRTRPADWEQTQIDLTAFIRQVNRAKAEHPVFQEDAPTAALPSDNPNILFLWKGSLHAQQEALIILNKDIWNKQHFATPNLCLHLQTQSPLTDISPEHSLDFLPTPYEYDLRPGQGIVLVTRKGQK
jgi:starch synthase (maltosyl-transferring)